MTLGLAVLAAMLLAIALGLPIGIAIGTAGTIGFALISGAEPALTMMAQTTMDALLNYNLVILPLFVLMGNLIARSELADDLYSTAQAFIGHRKGGLAMATILACGGFSALCGSSLATSATMGKIAIPAMLTRGYPPSLAVGSVSAGGTLGILFPPSIAFVLYGIITQNDIGVLFMAGILPGFVAVACYIGAIMIVTRGAAGEGMRSALVPWAKRGAYLRRIWGVMVLFGIVIGGIYTGIFTATEAAGIGAFTSFLFALLRRSLTPAVLWQVLVQSARTSAMLFAIVVAALIFANFVNISGTAAGLRDFVTGLDVSPFTTLLAILAIYLLLGCFLESTAIILLTTPIFYPIVIALGYDPIWFGVILVVVVEIGLITPPIGLNLFVVQAVVPSVSMRHVFRGAVPFVTADLVRLTILLLVPAISLTIPEMMQ